MTERAASGEYSEDRLVERPTIALFEKLGWETARCFREFDGARSTLGRESRGEVVLVERLRRALERLNPGLSSEAIEHAIGELTRDRSRMSLAAANREIYRLIKDGVRVGAPDSDGEGDAAERVRIVDWCDRGNNDFLLCSQFWVTGEMYTKRADLVGFVNGLPLLFIEIKAVHKRLETAYTGNLTDYKSTIPQLLWYNALVILSNGSESKLGSITAGWEHFTDWRKINSEGEEGIISLETMVRGACEPSRFLDLVENFALFSETRHGLAKLVAKNHQYLGVNNTIEALREIESREGRLGVFWHTQGSGKSISMIFFCQKVLRKIPGDWSFVIVTDRRELDQQIYENFANAGVVTEAGAHADDSRHLRRLLRENHRYVFTLIHKFRTERGEAHPVLSERSDIIVITDEAHRTQYDTLALNMRTALPNASFIAFTGTPLIVGEEKTRQVFGDYVSVYDFKQSVDDESTVPLYYENRIPELQLTNEDLNQDMERLLEDAELDAEQEKKLEREFAREYHLITRDDRLDAVAADIVGHFLGRGFRGKAMVVCIDKATAIRMYDKAQAFWEEKMSALMDDAAGASDRDRDELIEQLDYMRETDMAVVVSPGQNEIEEMKAKGLDIVPHRRRTVDEDLDAKFKDPDDPFRIVFVCAMWMTGFDVPSCSTIYLDKPMRNHTLMQTIARANRVFPEKVSGLIVDYAGVFRDLERALAVYGSGPAGGAPPGEMPVRDKSTLVEELKAAIAEATGFCDSLGIDSAAIQAADEFRRVRLLADASKLIAGTPVEEEVDGALDAVLVNDESKKRFLTLSGRVTKLFKAVLPDPVGKELGPICTLLRVLAQKVRSSMPEVDISMVMERVGDLLDDSIEARGYVIPTGPGEGRVVDLSRIDFDALRAKFEQGRKHTAVDRLRSRIHVKLLTMARLNRTRMNFLERFQRMIEEYNAGSVNIDEFFERLVGFAGELEDEERRAIAEQLSEEELAVFDLLTKPEMNLTPGEIAQVKKVARGLLRTLREGKLVLDWRKRQQSRAQVRVAIEKLLDTGLPAAYSPELFQRKSDAVFQHVYDSYYGAGRSVYAAIERSRVQSEGSGRPKG